MKLTVICTKREETIGSHGDTLYTYHFGVKRISDDMKIQREAGSFVISSIDPLHYKHMAEYSMNSPSTLLLI